MLFLNAILFFVLGASVVARPITNFTKPTPGVETLDDSDLDGHWLCLTKKCINHIIYIKNNHILEASPELDDPYIDFPSTKWKRATKSSVNALKLPGKMMEKIPEEAAEDQLTIMTFHDPVGWQSYFEVVFEQSGKSGKDKKLILPENFDDHQ